MALVKAWPTVMPTSSTVWWASIWRSPSASTSRSSMPWRATWSSMWSKNPTPVASLDLPLPSRLRRTSICVSRGLRVTWAWRMGERSGIGLILTQLRQCGRRRRRHRPIENFAQRPDQRLAFRIRADRNAQVGRNPGRILKISHDDAAPAQLCRQFRAGVPGVTDKHEVRSRGDDVEIQFLETGNQALAAFDDPAPGIFEIGLILHCRHGTRLGEAIQRIGIETVLHPVQGLDKIRMAYRVTDAKPGKRTRLGQGMRHQQVGIA